MTKHWKEFFEDYANQFELARPEKFKPDELTHTSTVWAGLEGAICQATNVDYLNTAMENPNVACIITDAALESKCSDTDKAIIFAHDSGDLFLRAHSFYASSFNESEGVQKVASTADIHPSSSMSGDVIVGENVKIGPNTALIGPVTIEDNTTISANVVIGEEGLFAKTIDDKLSNIPHCGGVVIGHDCYIHAGAVVVKSAFAGLKTTIGCNSHIGVMTNVGHDVTIGDETVISSNCVIAGRTIIGNRCWIGASSTLSNGVRVGDDADVKIGSVVVNDVPANTMVSGNFAFSHKRHLKQHVSNRR